MMPSTTTTPGPIRGATRRRLRWVRRLSGVMSIPAGRSKRCLYSSTSSRASSSRYLAYVRRNVLTNVGPGRSSHSSLSSARRYFARIFVAASTSAMSIRRRIRASRRVSPISGMDPERLVLGVIRDRHCVGARIQRREHAREVGLGHQHLARLGALVARDHPAALEHVDQTAGARVAQPQAALEHRGRGGLHLGDEPDGVAQKRILVRVEAVVGAARLCRILLDLLEQLLAEVGLTLAPPALRELLDLGLVDERALDALQAGGADGREEHVAHAQ